MSRGEREALSGLISMLLSAGLIAWWLISDHAAGAFDGPEGLQAWARTVLMLIGAGIGIAIVVTIVTHVVEAAVTGEKPDERQDERDHLLERRALTWGWYVLSIGILGIIVDLAMGASAFRALNLLIVLCALSEGLKDSLKLWFYRRGG